MARGGRVDWKEAFRQLNQAILLCRGVDEEEGTLWFLFGLRQRRRVLNPCRARLVKGRRTANAPRSRLRPRSPSSDCKVQGPVDMAKQEVPVSRLSQGRVILDRH